MKLVLAAFVALISLLSSPGSARDEINLFQPKFDWRATGQNGQYNQRPFKVSIAQYDLLIIELQSPNPGIGEVSWRTKQEKFSNKRTYPFYVKKSAKPKTYYVDLKAYLKDNEVDHFLFFGPAKSKLLSLRAVKGSFSEKLIAAWQEFWGPQGRERAGAAFTIIRPVMLFGRSIFVYLNWLIGLMIVIALIKKRPKPAISAILVLWVLLEVSSLVNNWHFFKADQKFWGKSLEEKRAMQNYKDFYQFIKFAEKKIPANSGFHLITRPKYRFSVERASYYLYPRPWQEKPEYILLFDKIPNKNILKRYKILATFRPGAYILRGSHGTD